ncbi:urea ABC transporter substrate-binding protein [Deinococcus roseus]|uniref:Urea ABC transporter substrate-binding protein n=1 Tax=Deinococcus roseus TaxID=392414 RepID=A0ABQ2D399_9DEIO|nr:urea ABC transporter substrate-binding protein [Deinococcus roseus]
MHFFAKQSRGLLHKVAGSAIISLSVGLLAGAQAEDVKVGVLHSLTGTMAISEITVKNATLLAIEEINKKGGVMGKTIASVIEDGASEPATFAQKAQKLIEQDKVSTVFGGWTSASRKAMLPVFERLDNLLWYPVQFEGNECSPNIMYSGAQPNQQILPAFDWAVEKGFKKYFLVGSDYVFPRTANLIVKKHIENDKLTLTGEEYVPLGGTDFSSVINKIKAGGPAIIFNTINGDSNVAFFKQLAAAGLTAKDYPVMSFSIAEQEAKAIGPKLLEGSYAAWNYFMSLPNTSNKAFIKAYAAKYGKEQLITDPMIHGYVDVYIWKAAVEKAKSFEPDKVRKAAVSIKEITTPMGKIKFDANQSLYQTAYVGQLKADGQFKILWDSKKNLKPEPYDALAFPGKTCKP